MKYVCVVFRDSIESMLCVLMFYVTFINSFTRQEHDAVPCFHGKDPSFFFSQFMFFFIILTTSWNTFVLQRISHIIGIMMWCDMVVDDLLLIFSTEPNRQSENTWLSIVLPIFFLLFFFFKKAFINCISTMQNDMTKKNTTRSR